MSGQDEFQEDAFEQSAQNSVAACAGLSLRDAGRALASDGLLGVLAPELVGGLGLDLKSLLPVTRAAARANLVFPATAANLAAAALAEAMPELAAAIAGGETVAVLGVRNALAEAGDPRLLSGTADGVPLADRADWLLLPSTLHRPTVAVVKLTDPNVSFEMQSDLDPQRPRFRIRMDKASVLALVKGKATRRLCDDHAVLVAIDQMAAAEAALAEAVRHLSIRRQFGRTLIQFQALRHQLSRAQLALSSLEMLAGRVLSGLSAPDHLSAFASEHCARIAEVALQCQGAMGFTEDNAAHRHLRRIRAASMAAMPLQWRRAIIASI